MHTQQSADKYYHIPVLKYWQEINVRQNIGLTRPKCAFPACWTPPWPWTLTFWPKTWSVHPCPKMHQSWKFSENISGIFFKIFLTTVGTHGQRTHEQPKNTASGRNTWQRLENAAQCRTMSSILYNTYMLKTSWYCLILYSYSIITVIKTGSKALYQWITDYDVSCCIVVN